MRHAKFSIQDGNLQADESGNYGVQARRGCKSFYSLRMSHFNDSSFLRQEGYKKGSFRETKGLFRKNQTERRCSMGHPQGGRLQRTL
jgi:hypothetical protein